MANGGLIQAARRGGQAGPRPILASPFAGWLPKHLWNRIKDPFAYGVDFLPLAATTALNIAIQNDADFVIVSGVAVVTEADNVTNVPLPPFTALITDQAAGRNYSNQPVHFNNYFGTAQLPKYWDIPKVVQAGGTLTVQLALLAGAATRLVRITFHGFKVFPAEISEG